MGQNVLWDSKEEKILKYKIWLSILLVTSILAGCSLPLENRNQKLEENEKGYTLGLTPDFSYEVKEQLPNILVNQVGYLPQSSKIAILQGNDLEKIFYVYNAITGKQEFVGTLKPDSLFSQKEDNPEGGKKENYLADFSALSKTGSFYIYHEDLGYSYLFQIKNGIYDDIEKELITMMEREKEDTSLLCYQLACFLFAKELYPENLLEADRLERVCREKIENLMLAQDEKTGSVYVDISIAKRKNDLDEVQKQQFISLTATAAYAGVMAEYAFQIKGTDRELANRCQIAAEQAYKSIQNSLDNVGFDAGYFAVTYLYRLTGREKYSQAISQYMAMKEEQKSYTEYDFSLFGDYAYITLPQGTKLELGENLMKKIMSRAEEISLTSGRNSYYVSDKKEYNEISGKLKGMSNMALVNYIITNHEYSTLIKNYVDYFMGRNPENICYIDGFGVRTSEEGQPKVDELNCGLFYLLLQAAKI